MSNEVFLKRNTTADSVNNPVQQPVEGKIPDRGTTEQNTNIPGNFNIPDVVKNKLMQQATSKYPTETFDLPSKGWFYPEDNPASKGVIEFRMMTAYEEDILTSQKLLKNETAIPKVIERLIVTPGIKPDTLLLCDYNAIVYFVRRVAYGNDYGPFSVQCESCGETAKFQHVDLSQFEFKDVDFESYEKGTNHFKFVLPYSNREVTFKLITMADSKVIDNEIQTMSKMNRIGLSSNITTRLKYTITSVDGKTDLTYISRFVQNDLISRDSAALRAYINEVTPELDTTFTFTCPSCGMEARMEVPMTSEFFWPKSRV